MTADIALGADFAVIVVVATVLALLAHRLRQPTVVAYIVAGLLLGPAALGVVTPGEVTETMAELGLAFLLFLLGIKMRIEDVRHVIEPVVKISIPQMAFVAATGGVTSYVLGFTVWESVIIGLAVMYSSTAVVVKMLTDKDEATTLPGKIDVGVLLVQDIVVVILLALLAAGVPDGAVEVAVNLATILVFVAVIGVAALASSRYLLPRVFRRIADDEYVFLVISISWAFLFVLLSIEMNLSIEMGAFLAGIAIAQLPYSRELQDRVTPLTDLFMLIFFASVGLQLGADDLFAYWWQAVVASLVLMPAKFAVFFYLIDWQNFDVETTFIGSVNMVQVSEFGLVVGAAAVAGGFIDDAVLGFLTVIALVTMSVSVYFVRYNHELYSLLEPRLQRWETGEERRKEATEHRGHAVVVGYDDVTFAALPVLHERYGDVVVIDRKVEHVEALEETPYTAVYGDFRHGKVRKEAGFDDAEFVLSSSVEADVNEALLAAAPSTATVFVEAEWLEDAHRLYEAGADFVVMATHLAGERIAGYLESYFTDRERFERDADADVEAIYQASGDPDVDIISGGDDDD